MVPRTLLPGLVAASLLLPAAAADTTELPGPCDLVDACDPLPPPEVPDPRPLLCPVLVCTQAAPPGPGAVPRHAGVAWCASYELPGFRVPCGFN